MAHILPQSVFAGTEWRSGSIRPLGDRFSSCLLWNIHWVVAYNVSAHFGAARRALTASGVHTCLVCPGNRHHFSAPMGGGPKATIARSKRGARAHTHSLTDLHPLTRPHAPTHTHTHTNFLKSISWQCFVDNHCHGCVDFRFYSLHHHRNQHLCTLDNICLEIRLKPPKSCLPSEKATPVGLPCLYTQHI